MCAAPPSTNKHNPFTFGVAPCKNIGKCAESRQTGTTASPANPPQLPAVEPRDERGGNARIRRRRVVLNPWQETAPAVNQPPPARRRRPRHGRDRSARRTGRNDLASICAGEINRVVRAPKTGEASQERRAIRAVARGAPASQRGRHRRGTTAQSRCRHSTRRRRREP